MFRRLTTAMVIGAALVLPGHAHASTARQVMPFGTKATYHIHHALYVSGLSDDRGGWVYALPPSIPQPTIVQPSTSRAVHRATRRRPRHAHRTHWREPIKTRPIQPPQNGFHESMLITYYTDVGPMADGVETYWGAAACGYDLALGTRVSVPGVGLLTCHDRMCTTCPGVPFRQHIDVWGYRPGLGSDWRMVTVY